MAQELTPRTAGAREIPSAEAPMLTGLREIPTAKERREVCDRILAKAK